MRTRIPISIPIFGAMLLVLSGCAQRQRSPEPPPPPPPPPVEAPVVDTTPLRFNVDAGSNDTWNAVGQILVRTPGVTYDGRAQMLGLNAIRYRGEALMLLTRALPISDTVKTLTTEVTVTTTQGKAMYSDSAAELLALLARELPQEIERVKAGLAAQKRRGGGAGKSKAEGAEEEVVEVRPAAAQPDARPVGWVGFTNPAMRVMGMLG